MNLFVELHRHDRLSFKRSPFHEMGRVTRFLISLFAGFWVCYLIFIGITMAFALDDGAVEPYHIMNSGLIVVLLIDFVVRMAFMKTPTQEMKPYLLLPIKRSRLTDFLLLRSALSPFNLLWLAMFVPFALLTVTRFYGMWGVVAYCFGIWMLIVANNYWYQLCRILILDNMLWMLLPVAIYGGGIALLYASHIHSTNSDFFRDLGDGLITADPYCLAGTAAVTVLLFAANRMLIRYMVYNELNKVKDAKVSHVSEYKFLNRFGLTGQYMALELKMLLRNKVCRQQLTTISLIVVAFSLIIGLSDLYSGGMKDFLVIYNYVIFGTMFLGNMMSFEGNYMDGLMSRKESIYTLLRAKYRVYSIAMFTPTLFLTPAILTGSVSALTCLSWQLFTSGAVFCGLFQLAVFNNRAMPMNEKMTNRNYAGTGTQNIISLSALGLPVMLGFGLMHAIGRTATGWTLMCIGLALMLTSDLWIRNVYRRFMARRYANMEGFRNSRQK